MIAGDSAGGNLTLVTIAWARDQGLRPVDAAVALAPATDGTMSSPSLLSNIATDHLIGPMFGSLAKIPRWLLLLGYALRYGIRPANPLVSPAHHDLSRLPHTLMHVARLEPDALEQLMMNVVDSPAEARRFLERPPFQPESSF